MVEQLINICLKDYLNKTPMKLLKTVGHKETPINNSALKSFL
jgi:hypothetical protein